MQIKNRNILNLILLFNLFLFSINANAEEFNITADEIIIDKENEIIIGKGSVKAEDSNGRIISADKITYEKTKEFLLAEKNVKIFDVNGNILKTDKATYDKLEELIKTFSFTEIITVEGYKIQSKNISYLINKKILSSNEESILSDDDGNIIKTSMFQFNLENYLFSSIGKIKITDIKNNKYFFKELHVNTKKKEMVGSDISAVLDQKTFGLTKKNDPRLVANDIFVSKDKSEFSKGVFTICKKKDGKCPAWSIKAKKITHDSVKKTIYYEHAVLKVYDVPIFYFPKFFHPDPTVKRQSGFLAPFFTNNTKVGSGFALPYYWAVSNDRDFTFSPKIYTKENALFLNEYRQAFRNGFLTLDTGYTEGYKNITSTKTKGSRSHIFADLDLNLNQDETYESNFALKVQTTSNDTYLRIHDINTALVDSENTNLENEIKYSFSKEDMYFDIYSNAFMDLRQSQNSDKYEYIFPNINFGKTFYNNNLGIIDFKSNVFYSNYETNKHKTFLINDITWNPFTYITQKGFVSSLKGMLRNTNYETKKTKEFKDDNTVNELNAVLAHTSSFPMKKDGMNYSNLLSPNFMLRYAPAHMRDLSQKDVMLKYSNLYSLNKTSEIEQGLSAVLGFDFKINEKESGNVEKERLSLSLGQVFNHEENGDLPSRSSLDQQTSDLVGEINYNFSEIGEINYQYSLDHNLSDLNYNEISTKLNFGRVKFNLDYLEQQNHIGKEHYASSGVTLDINEFNTLSFSTKKNFKTDSTELYNLNYQYSMDCLTAGLVYRREFYDDVDDLEPKNSLMFTFSFVPFANVSTPIVKP